MKYRILASVLALAAVLAVAAPASAQVIVSQGYTPYAGTVVTPGTTYGVPGVGSVTVGGYSPYTTGYYMSPSTTGYYSGYSPYGYSSYYSGYSSPYMSGYTYSYPSYGTYYSGYGRGWRRWY
jgi:hypothetical protein